MADVRKFPNRFRERFEEDDNPYTQGLPPLLNLPRQYVFDQVFEVNREFLGVIDYDVADMVEFFEDGRYPGAVLVDISIPGIRGLYRVDLDSFILVKIMDNTLIHFK